VLGFNSILLPDNVVPTLMMTLSLFLCLFNSLELYLFTDGQKRQQCVIVWAQVKRGDVVQVSLIIISVNSSTHLGRYTLTASNVAGTAAGGVTVQLMTSSSASSQSDVTERDPDLVTDSALSQRPITEHHQLTGELYRCALIVYCLLLWSNEAYCTSSVRLSVCLSVC